MPQLADIFCAHGPQYLAKYGPRMLPSHRRAMDDICTCRTRTRGGHVFVCQPCGEYRYSYHSCKNRNCPKCQNDQTTQWLETLSALLVPVPHFMVTVTLPATLRGVARRNQKLIYGLLFRCAAGAMQKLARDPRLVGGRLGFIGVLQTWTRDLRYHLHIHFIVPAGALSDNGKRWRRTQHNYLMPQRALALILRAKFRDALHKTQLSGQVPPGTWQQQWIVDICPVGSGQEALAYLAPYIFRTAISNKRILRLENGQVTFQYKASQTGQWKTKTLPAEKFISGFLQHVLPYRFVKVRYYGFYSTRNHQLFERIKALLHMKPTTKPRVPSTQATVPLMRCPQCGQPMLWVRRILPRRHRPP